MEYHFETKEHLRQFIVKEVFTSSEAMEYLQLTRQGLNSLVQRGKLHPIKEEKAVKLFFKLDLIERKETAKPGRPQKSKPF